MYLHLHLSTHLENSSLAAVPWQAYQPTGAPSYVLWFDTSRQFLLLMLCNAVRPKPAATIHWWIWQSSTQFQTWGPIMSTMMDEITRNHTKSRISSYEIRSLV